MGLEFREVEAGMVMPVRGAERHRHHVGRGSRHTPLPQGGSIGQPPAYLLSSAASAPSSGSSAIGGEGREPSSCASGRGGGCLHHPQAGRWPGSRLDNDVSGDESVRPQQ